GYATHRQKVDRQRPCPCLFSEANQISIKCGLTGGLLGRSICELVCGPRAARITQGLCSRRFFPFKIQGEGHGLAFLEITVRPATMSTAGRRPKSSSAAVRPDGCACTDSREPASNPGTAYIAPAHGSASPSAAARRRAQRSGACYSQGI